jgi:hypothetical protein
LSPEGPARPEPASSHFDPRLDRPALVRPRSGRQRLPRPPSLARKPTFRELHRIGELEKPQQARLPRTDHASPNPSYPALRLIRDRAEGQQDFARGWAPQSIAAGSFAPVLRGLSRRWRRRLRPIEVAVRYPILDVRIAPEAGLAPDVLTTHICSL